MKTLETPAIAPTTPGNDRTVEEFDMGNSTCSISDCEAVATRRGWCSKHWFRWYRHGDPAHEVAARATTVEEAFRLHTERQGACLVWTGTISSNGYGAVRHQGAMRGAHRVAYELAVGPIAEGMEIDHTCHNTRCVNVTHLRQVTKKQNAENASGAYKSSKSGVRGVSWDKRYHRWSASVRHNGVKHWVGYFDSLSEAEAAVKVKRNELFTHNGLDRATPVLLPSASDTAQHATRVH